MPMTRTMAVKKEASGPLGPPVSHSGPVTEVKMRLLKPKAAGMGRPKMRAATALQAKWTPQPIQRARVRR